MTYRVSLLRAVEQHGAIEIDAATEDEARQIAMELATGKGTLTRKPTWAPDVVVRDIVTTDVKVA